MTRDADAESTLRLTIENNGASGDTNDQWETGDAWSPRSRGRLIAPITPGDLVEQRSRTANTTADRTLGPATPLDVTGVRPVTARRSLLGKKGFAPLYQWEGVVEEVNGAGFRARLRPFENGHANAAQVEYTDFDYDDLADESDLDFVAEGAVFYWTVGKSRNEWGTVTNTSLVRFRRLPPRTPHQTREASRQADELLVDLGVEQST